MRTVMAIAAFALAAACSSAPGPAVPTATAATPAPVQLSKAEQKAKDKAEGVRCDRDRSTLGSNRTTAQCKSKAQREAAVEAGRESKGELNDYNQGANSLGNLGVGNQ